MTQETLVVGGGPVGLALATRLASQNHPVMLVGEHVNVRSHTPGEAFPVHKSSLDEPSTYPDLTATTAVAATRSDSRNLLVTALAPTTFDADRVVALVNDPRNRLAFDDAGIETVCVSEVVARATVARVVEERSISTDEPSEPTDERTGTRERLRE